jgi:hypothetical protein
VACEPTLAGDGLTLDDFLSVVDGEGRLHEVVEASRLEGVRAIVTERMAARHGVAG